jgi:OOP family OmpA-OmpF porin
MKRIILMALLCTAAGMVGPALAGSETGYVVDSSGRPTTDSSGECVRNPYREQPNEECEPAPPEPEPVAAPEPVFEAVTLQSDTFFEFDDATLKPAARERLDQLVARLAGVAELEVAVRGHTDSIGSEAYNQRLSEQRALSVKDYLIDRGVSPAAVRTMGMGEAEPIASNSTAEGRAQNRRVEIEIRGQRQT